MYLVPHKDLEKFLWDYDGEGILPVTFIGEYVWIDGLPGLEQMRVFEPSKADEYEVR